MVKVVAPDSIGMWCYERREEDVFINVAYVCPHCESFNYVERIRIGDVVECSECGVKVRLNETIFNTAFDLLGCGGCYACQAGYIGGIHAETRVDELVKFLKEKIKETREIVKAP